MKKENKETKYEKRFDGRNFDQLRPIEAKIGIIKNADGSASFRMGDTYAIASVFGPRDLRPRFLQNPQKGILRCTYDMVSFSVTERKRPGPNRRSVEVSLVTEWALAPVVCLDEYPNTVIDVYIEIVQANAGTRCAGICAAALALASAGILMKDLVSAVSVGKIGDKIALDIIKEEEDFDPATDIPIAFTPRTGELTLLQLDGSVSREELKKAIELAKKGCQAIYDIQKKTLKEHFSKMELENDIQ